MEINGRGQLQLWEVLLLSLPPMDFAHSVTASRFAQWEPLAAKAVGGEGAPAAAQHVLR